MPLKSGTRLGPYEILQPIGAGGMGEVYRARDTKLDRDVAVKVLPPSLADDPAALARFEREAKSVAQLSHPNILGIFDFGREAASTSPGTGPTAFAVMELLQGETLRERLNAGPLNSRKAVECAVQIAHGLAAAHDKGIVHRDLKPENLFVTNDDRVKILDFGLAKPIDLGGAGATVTSPAETASGAIMGTIGYMAPEQVRGLAVDHRCDIFAFGAVLYELISGRRAFDGDSPADTMSAILNAEPPELDAVAGVAPALDRVARRCLEKKPELRFQSAHDLAFALEALSGRTSGPVAVMPIGAPARQPAGSRLPWAIAAIALVAAAISSGLLLRAPAKEIPWRTFTAITDAAGVETTPSISPDGGTVAYATHVSGSWDIEVQRVGGRTAVPVAADPERDELSPAYSPDGLFIAYHQSTDRGGLFIVGATGESARRVTDFGFHPAWSPDGRQLAFTSEEIVNPYSRQGASALWVVDAAGGQPVEIKGTGDAAQPSWSPSGARVAYWSTTAGQRDIYTVPARGGERVALTNDAALDWGPIWSPDGKYVYFSSDRGGFMNVWRRRIDEQSGRPAGDFEPVTTGVQASSALPSLSKDGTRLAFRSSVEAINPVAVSWDPVTLQASAPVVLNDSNTIRIPAALSADGKHVAFYNIGERQEDIFLSALDGSGLRRITDDMARDRMPSWSHDGKSVYFYSTRGGEWEIWSIDADGGGLHRVAGIPGEGVIYPLVSPAGDRLMFTTSTSNGVYLGTLANGVVTAPRKLPGTAEAILTATSWSPDGSRFVASIGSEGGKGVGIAVYDVASSKITRRIDVETLMARWLPDGRRVCLFTHEGATLLIVDVDTGQRQVVQPVQPWTAQSSDAFTLGADGHSVLYGRRRSEADIWIVEKK